MSMVARYLPQAWAVNVAGSSKRLRRPVRRSLTWEGNFHPTNPHYKEELNLFRGKKYKEKRAKLG